MASKIQIKTPVDSSMAKTAISLGGTGFLSPQLAKQFENHLSEIIAVSGTLLRVAIENKIALIQPAHKRNRKWYWKKLNKMLKVDSDYIELSGVELLAARKLISEETDEEVYPKCTYLVPFEEAQRILTKLDTNVKPC